MTHSYKLAGLILFYLATVQFAFAQTYPRIKDDPQGRFEYERQMLINPFTGTIPENIRENELNYVLSTPSLNDYSLNKAASWSNRGPFNVGGRTRALAIDKANESIILAGGVSGGMWRTTNGGTSWVKTTGSSVLHSVTCIAQDPRAGQTNVWYYATGEGTGNSASGGGAAYRGNGIYKSIDNGLTWSHLTSTGADPTVFSGGFQYNWNITVNPIDGYVYCATAGGIFRSIDGGTSWANVLDAGVSSVKYTDIAVTTTGVLYATINSAGTPNKGIYRSTDGVNWTNIYTGLPTTYDRICVAIAPSNQNVVYFFANTPATGKNDHSFYKYTYVSGNGSGTGGTWLNRSTNLPAFGGSVGNLSQGSYNQYVKVKPDNENVVFIGSTNVYRSTDAFATTTNNRWIGGYSPANNVSRYPNHHPDNHSFVFFPSSSITVLSGHDGGISKTIDILRNNTGNEPVAWTELNNGYLTTQPYSVAIDQVTSGDNRIMAGFQDNGKWYSNSTSGTVIWGEEVAGGDGCYTAIAPGTASNIRYHGTQNGSILRSVGNDPANPTDVDGIQPSTATGQLFVNPFILDPNNSNIMYYAGGARVWRNSNLAGINSGYTFSGTATNWTNMTGTAITGTISALAVSKTAANVLYYGTTNGQVYRVDNANTGTGTRIDIYTGKGFPAGAYVSCLTVDPSNAANVIVVFSNYGVKSIFYSTNSGVAWTDISGNLEQNADGTGNGPSVRWAEIHTPASGGKVYLVGTSTGLYATETLNGTATSWVQEGATTIGNVVVMMIKGRSSDGLVAVATHANGLYSATVTATGVPTCAVPASLASSSVTSNSATVSWGAVSGAVSYDLQYRVNGTTTWTSVTGITTTSRALTGLTASTTYEFQVRTNCSGSSSAFSASATFLTTGVVTCNVPTSLASSSVTSNSATVSWGAVSGAVSYDLQYRVNGTTTWTSVTGITTTSRALTGLTASTNYEFQVRTNCSGSSSAFSASATFGTSAVTVTYCTGNGTNTVDEWIQRVTLGTIDNTSGNNSGYGNYTSLATSIARSASATITIFPAWSGTVYSEGYAVWIDYNQDGDFVDTGELVYSRARTTLTSVSGSFTVPATALIGNTRMRVKMQYNATPTAPCGSFTYGEVEDYTINITASGTALNPQGLDGNGTFDITKLYPNPSTGEAKVVVFVPERTNLSIALTNIHGQGIQSASYQDVEGVVEHTINNLRSGIYFVNVVKENGEKIVRKLIVQ